MEYGNCIVCGKSLLNSEERLELHHIKPLKEGGTWQFKNLAMIHETCHKQVTYNKEENNKLAHNRDIVL